MSEERFNPHPSRRTGATMQPQLGLDVFGRFNPHPSRRTGATLPFLGLLGLPVDVSILTRPGGRVQRIGVGQCRRGVFQSSPVPEDGCNGVTVSNKTGLTIVSILTRPGGRVQRRTTALNSTQLSSFSAKQRR